MSDVFDILDLERSQTPIVTKSILDGKRKKKEVSDATFKKPKGMNREIYALICSNKKDNPPVDVSDTDLGYKQKKADIGLKKDIHWVWKPFTNSARKDDAVFHHWERTDQENKDYPFAKFNKVVFTPEFTDDEYILHLQCDGWTRRETDHLLDLCRHFDLRFIIMQDRWDRTMFPPRSVEDLKERYYNICNILAKLRAVGDVKPKLMHYNGALERKRKEQLNKLYDRTPEQLEEEDFLRNEMLKIEIRKKERERKTQDVQKLITATEGCQSKCLDKKAPKRKDFQSKTTKAEGASIDSAGIKFADFKGSSVSLRSQKMKLPASLGQKKTKAVEQLLHELDIDPNPVPTEGICKEFNELCSDIVLLYELKLACANYEFELEALKHQEDA